MMNASLTVSRRLRPDGRGTTASRMFSSDPDDVSASITMLAAISRYRKSGIERIRRMAAARGSEGGISIGEQPFDNGTSFSGRRFADTA